MEWYEKFEFDEDPFSIDPEENHDKLVGMDEAKEEIIYRVESGSIAVIEGLPGTGKTTLLMVAARKFGGNRNVAYVDCKVLDKNLNITQVLLGKYSFFGKLFNKKPKNMIVLLDNVSVLSQKNNERLKYYFDQNYIKSVIFATERYSGAKFSESLKDRIGNRVFKIPKLKDQDAIEIIRKRIGDSELFNDDIIAKIFKLSHGSPKELLENCRKAAMEASRKDRNRVQLVDLKVLAGDKNE
ncbi:MAG: ATP-binding protein [Nanoarchaeota archaeon]|nr:ATP-binding protein [Nanoarchaeota archaeon]